MAKAYTRTQIDFRKWFLGELKKNEITQRRFANEAGLAEATVSRWATGTHFPKAEELDITLSFFNTHIEFVKN